MACQDYGITDSKGRRLCEDPDYADLQTRIESAADTARTVVLAIFLVGALIVGLVTWYCCTKKRVKPGIVLRPPPQYPPPAPGAPLYTADGVPVYPVAGVPMYPAGAPAYPAGAPAYPAGAPAYTDAAPPYNAGAPPYNAGAPFYTDGVASHTAAAQPYAAGAPPYTAGAPPYTSQKTAL